MFSEILNGILLLNQERTVPVGELFNPQNPGIKLGIIPAGVLINYQIHILHLMHAVVALMSTVSPAPTKHCLSQNC